MTTKPDASPDVTVMITVYNGVTYLAEAIESVLRQTYQPLELIVIDDGSDDGSGEVATRYLSSLRYEYHARMGMGAARNLALSLAQGRYLTFLDADDRFSPDAIALQMDAFAQDPSLDIVYGHLREFLSPDFDPSLARKFRPAADKLANRLANGTLIRREASLRIGPFATNLKVGLGIDWSLRIKEQGLKSRTLDDIVMERRLHANNNGRRERDANLEFVQILKASLDRRRMASSPLQDPSRRE